MLKVTRQKRGKKVDCHESVGMTVVTSGVEDEVGKENLQRYQKNKVGWGKFSRAILTPKVK